MKKSTLLTALTAVLALALVLPAFAQEKPASDKEKATEAAAPAPENGKQEKKNSPDKKADKNADKSNNAVGDVKEGDSCPVLPKVENFSGSTLACVMGCKECAIFAKAIHDSGIENMLADAAECTIFVPDDKAFADWSQADKDALFSCPSAMSVLVLNHVCPSNMSPEDLCKLCKEKLDNFCKDAEEAFGKENAEKCKEFCCKAMKKLHHHGWGGSEDGVASRTEGECPREKALPSKILKCDNGYVYVINKVQVPRVLKVYKKLAAAQEAPAVMVEEISVSVE
ncbi:MAG: fasciclin domain-containing protein [Planctomycetia bacterium]|nr:fasciclin domain-containing protein [Planctomycetia bacterium]